jgi:hypothetical protein
LRNAILIAADAREVRYESNEVVTMTARFWYDYYDES